MCNPHHRLSSVLFVPFTLIVLVGLSGCSGSKETPPEEKAADNTKTPKLQNTASGVTMTATGTWVDQQPGRGPEVVVDATGKPAANAVAYGNIKVSKALANTGDELRLNMQGAGFNNPFRGMVQPGNESKFAIHKVTHPKDGIRLVLKFQPTQQVSSIRDLQGSFQLQSGSIKTLEVKNLAPHLNKTVQDDQLNKNGIEASFTVFNNVAVEYTSKTKTPLAVVELVDGKGRVHQTGRMSLVVIGTDRYVDRWAIQEADLAGAQLRLRLPDQVEDLAIPFAFTDLQVPPKPSQQQQGDQPFGKIQTIDGPDGLKLEGKIRWSRSFPRRPELIIDVLGDKAKTALRYGTLKVDAIKTRDGTAIQPQPIIGNDYFKNLVTINRGTPIGFDVKHPANGIRVLVKLPSTAKLADVLPKFSGSVTIQSPKGPGIVITDLPQYAGKVIANPDLAKVGVTLKLALKRYVVTTVSGKNLMDATIVDSNGQEKRKTLVTGRTKDVYEYNLTSPVFAPTDVLQVQQGTDLQVLTVPFEFKHIPITK